MSRLPLRGGHGQLGLAWENIKSWQCFVLIEQISTSYWYACHWSLLAIMSSQLGQKRNLRRGWQNILMSGRDSEVCCCCWGFWGLAQEGRGGFERGGEGKPAWNQGMGVVVCDSRREQNKILSAFWLFVSKMYFLKFLLAAKIIRMRSSTLGELIGLGMRFWDLAVTKWYKEGLVFVLYWRQLRRGRLREWEGLGIGVGALEGGLQGWISKNYWCEFKQWSW